MDLYSMPGSLNDYLTILSNMRYINYYTNPSFPNATIEFGFWDRNFARKVRDLIPREWCTGTGGINIKGRIYVEVKRLHNLFWDLVKIVESMEDHGEVKLFCKEWEGSEKLIHYKHIKIDTKNERTSI